MKLFEYLYCFYCICFTVSMPRQVLGRKCMAYYHHHSWLYLNLQFQKINQMYMINNNGPNGPCETPLKMSPNYCKNDLPLFFASFFQGKMLTSIANLYLSHMHSVLQLIIDDRYNEKSCRGL